MSSLYFVLDTDSYLAYSKSLMIENKLFKDIFSYKGQSSLVLKAKEYLKKHHSLNYKKFAKTQLLAALANPGLPVGDKIEGDFVVLSVSMEKLKDQKNGHDDAVVVKILAKNTNQIYVLYFWSTSKISFSKLTKMKPKKGDILKLSGFVSGVEGQSIRLNRINFL